MNKVPALLLTLLLAAAGVFLLGFRAASGSSSDDPEPDGPTTSATPTQEPSSEPSGGDPGDDPSDTPSDPPEEEGCKEPEEAIAAFLGNQGFEEGDFVMRADVRWGQVPVQNVADSFTDEPLNTLGALRAFLDGNSLSSQVARQLIGDDLPQGYWVPVQFQTMMLYSGNYSWDEATGATQNNGVAQVAGGDIWWFNVDFWPDGCEIDLEDTIRAVCGNVGLTAIAPYAAPPSRSD